MIHGALHPNIPGKFLILVWFFAVRLPDIRIDPGFDADPGNRTMR